MLDGCSKIDAACAIGRDATVGHRIKMHYVAVCEDLIFKPTLPYIDLM
jgi:hypothetical protein